MTLTQNITPETIQLGQVTYKFTLVIGPIEGSIVQLRYDKIGSAIIINDIVNSAPQLIVTYTDVGFQAISKLTADGTSAMGILIQNENGTEQIGETFVLDGVELKSQGAEKAYFEIKATHSSVAALLARVPYAAKKENPIKTIQKLFGKLGFPLVSSVSLPKLEYDYISRSDATMADQISYLCELGSSTDLGAFFVAYNFSLQKSVIVSTQDYNPASYQSQDIETFMIPTKFGVEDRAMTVSEIKDNQHVDFSTMHLLMDDYRSITYDHLKRKWSTRFVQQNMFNRNSNPFPEMSATIFNGKQPKYKKQVYDQRHQLVGKQAREIALFTSSIEFKVLGNLRREVGAYINLNSASNPIFKKYGGLWMIAKIYHRLENRIYYNSIIAVRTSKINIDRVGGNNE